MSRRSATRDDAPLLAWGEALRSAKRRRKALLRRGAFVTIISGIVLAAAASPPSPRLVWNASASAPVGLYFVSPGSVPESGDMVVARLPPLVRELAAQRRYLPRNVPLVKRVAAIAGDRVCASGRIVTVNGDPVATRPAFDGMGHRMPFWLGCTRLRGRQVLLLMDGASSFDGRYFGVTEGRDVIGKARLLWER